MKRIAIGAVALLSTISLAGCNKKDEPAPATTQEQTQEQPQEKQTGLIDLTQMVEPERALKIADILDNPNTYDGCIIKVDGKNRKFHEEATDKDIYVCLTTYAEGEEPEGFVYVLSNNEYPKNGDLITVTGMLTNYTEVENETTYEYTELRDARVIENKSESGEEFSEDLITDFSTEPELTETSLIPEEPQTDQIAEGVETTEEKPEKSE